MTASVLLTLPGIDPWLNSVTSVSKTLSGTAFKLGAADGMRNIPIHLNVYADSTIIPNQLTASPPFTTPKTFNIPVSGGKVVNHILDAVITGCTITSNSGTVAWSNTYDFNATRVSYVKSNGLDANNLDLTALGLALNSTTALSATFGASLNTLQVNWDIIKAMGISAKIYYIDTYNTRKIATSFDEMPKDYFNVYRVIPASIPEGVDPTITISFTLDVLYTTATGITPDSLVLNVNPIWLRNIVISDTYHATVSMETVAKETSDRLDNLFIDSVTSVMYFKRKPDELMEQLQANGMNYSDAYAKVQSVVDRVIPSDVRSRFSNPSTIQGSYSGLKGQTNQSGSSTPIHIEPYGDGGLAIDLSNNFEKFWYNQDIWDIPIRTDILTQPIEQQWKPYLDNGVKYTDIGFVRLSEKSTYDNGLSGLYTFSIDLTDPTLVTALDSVPGKLNRFSLHLSMLFFSADRWIVDPYEYLPYDFMSTTLNAQCWITEGDINIKPKSSDIVNFKTTDHIDTTDTVSLLSKPLMYFKRVRKDYPEDELTAPDDFLLREGKKYYLTFSFPPVPEGTGIPDGMVMGSTYDGSKYAEIMFSFLFKEEAAAQLVLNPDPNAWDGN